MFPKIERIKCQRVEMKLSVIIIFLSIFITGCATSQGPNIYVGFEEVRIPPEYRTRRGCSWATSYHEMYLTAYEDGWWLCVGNYVKNIDHKRNQSELNVNGWMPRIDGFGKGYCDAERSIEKNIRKFGKKATHEYLTIIWEAK